MVWFGYFHYTNKKTIKNPTFLTNQSGGFGMTPLNAAETSLNSDPSSQPGLGGAHCTWGLCVGLRQARGGVLLALLLLGDGFGDGGLPAHEPAQLGHPARVLEPHVLQHVGDPARLPPQGIQALQEGRKQVLQVHHSPRTTLHKPSLNSPVTALSPVTGTQRSQKNPLPCNRYGRVRGQIPFTCNRYVTVPGVPGEPAKLLQVCKSPRGALLPVTGTVCSSPTANSSHL